MKKFVPSFIAGGLMFVAVAAQGEENVAPAHPLLNDRFFLAIGGFWTDSRTQARLSSSTLGLGAEVDLEDDLGLDEHKLVPIYMATWRFAERWRLDLEHFDIDRDGQRQLSRDIQWGNQTFAVSTQVGAKFKLDITRASIGYALFKTPDKELGIGFGADVTKLQADLSNSSASQDARTSGPLPVFSVYAAFAMTERWLFQTRFDQLQVKVGNNDGKVSGILVDLVYQPFRHVNFGLGYRTLDLEVNTERDSWRGNARIRTNGPTFFVGTTF